MGRYVNHNKCFVAIFHTVLHGSGDAGEVALQSEAKESVAGGVARKSTRTWAQQSGYEPEKIFNKVSGLL